MINNAASVFVLLPAQFYAGIAIHFLANSVLDSQDCTTYEAPIILAFFTTIKVCRCSNVVIRDLTDVSKVIFTKCLPLVN